MRPPPPAGPINAPGRPSPTAPPPRPPPAEQARRAGRLAPAPPPPLLAHGFLEPRHDLGLAAREDGGDVVGARGPEVGLPPSRERQHPTDELAELERGGHVRLV